MSQPTRTVRDLVREALRLLLDRDMAGFAGLWAADGVIEFPFAAPGSPRRLDGRAAVREYLRHYNDLVLPRALASCTVHDTADPAVAVVEFEVDGVVTATGLPYRMGYVAVVTARDGEIARYRDYWSPAAAAEILGGPAPLTAPLTGAAAGGETGA
ncbi:nuclear transport factor 2 family protein [Sphaerisporangium sp. TRM90804]|uniref:nuclear transport factor 2 family protein n=1 Tax=Sphaerisporangium sp. TRM90804 TaxID=3031113 RepID=UPI00244777A1|nr:nuclear transport factor 2 family protein [Sphaerisporangium sp. TRM90804]MDH2430577.1 nuclear transport factor 2 family protein [Sphaerisporangium sp. TRM90804]